MPGFKFISSGSSSSVPGIGVGAKNISVDSITATTANVTNLYGKRKLFNDKYTFPNGLGPYKTDLIPVQVKDKFAQSLFYSNTATQPVFTSTGSVDVTGNYEMVVSLPSKRTNDEYSVLYDNQDNECSNLGTFSMPLEDLYLLYDTLGFGSFVGDCVMSESLKNKCETFSQLCNSGTTTTEQRQNALTAIQTDVEYIGIKQNIKVPSKIYNQVVNSTGSDFIFDNLLALDNSTPMINTLTNGSTFNTQVTRSSYDAVASLLPPSQNINAINKGTGPKMGLFILFCGDGGVTDNIFYQSWHISALASLGYAAVIVPCTPWNVGIQKFGSTQTISKLCVDKVINNISYSSITIDTNPYVSFPYTYYVTNSASPSVFNMVVQPSDPNCQIVMERYFYQIKAVLNNLNVSQYIDFDNVMIAGLSRGGLDIVVSHNIFKNNGRALAYNDPTNPSSKAYIWKAKALLNYQGVFYDYKIKAITGVSAYNNKFRNGLGVLKIPMITITGDADFDKANSVGFAMGYNLAAQIPYQETAQAMLTDSEAYNALADSFVVYVPSTSHIVPVGTGALNEGQQSSSCAIGTAFALDWFNGWKMPQFAQFPIQSDVVQSGLLDEYNYAQMESYRRLCAIQLIAHRFLGNEYPVPDVALQTLGYRIDQAPQHVDYTTYFQTIKIGQCEFNYDVNSNVQINRSLFATGANQVIGATTLSSNTLTSAVATISGTGTINNISTTRINAVAANVPAIVASSATGPAIVTSAGGVQIGSWVLSVDGSGNLVINPA